MKQTWKSLKLLICSKQEWVNDSDQQNCQSCSKPFIRLLRRKHHCRSCGRIFCSNCSEYYINGTYIDENLEKYLRLCGACNQKVESSLRQLNIRLQQQLPQEDQYEETSSSDSDDLEQEIFPIFQQSQRSRNQKQLTNSIRGKLEVLSNLLCNNFGLQPIWKKKLSQFAFRAGEEVVIDSISGKNSMDITKTIKIQTVQSNRPEHTRIFKGYVSHNNVISKQMKTSFLKPKIIVIMGSIQISTFTDQKLKFQEIITKQKPILKKILGKLAKLNPDLVFVEQIVNFTAKQYLFSKGISVVCKVKQEVLQNIRKVAQIRKKVDKLWRVQTYKQGQIVGTCQKVYFLTHENNNKQKTLLYLQDDNSEIISIILAHTQVSQLQNLKKIMEQLLKFSRQLLLQKQIIQLEEFKIVKNNRHFQNGLINFLDEQLSLQRMLQLKHCTFSRSKYTPLKLSNFPDIQNIAQIQFYNKRSPYSFEHILQGHWQMCNNPTILTKHFYSENDISLGSHFLLQIANMNLNCDLCGKNKHAHVSVFNLGDNYVKVWLENPKKDEPQILHQQDKDKQVNIYISRQQLHVHLRQKFKGQAMNSKRKITSFIQCAGCNQILSEQVLISKQYLQNSFQYFMLKLLLSKQISYHFDSIQQTICQHTKLNRVIQSEDGALKFQAGKIQVYSLCDIDFTSQQSKSYLLQQDLTHINLMLFLQFVKLSEYVRSIIRQLQQITETSETLSKRAQKYHQMKLKLVQSCEALQAYILQTKDKYSSNIELSIKDYTPIKKQLNIIICYLDLIYKAFVKIQSFHKKDKKGQKGQEDYQLSEDINSENGSRLQGSGIEANVNLQNLKQFLDAYKKIQWGEEQQSREYNYAPIFRDNPVSLIAYALNSKSYQKAKDLNNEVSIKINLSESKPEIQSIKRILNPILEQFKIQGKSNKQAHTVKIIFPQQFQWIRNKFGIDLNLYIKSLIDCHDLHPAGGKSRSEFRRSYNHLLLIKGIKDKEFIEFAKFFPQYFQHIKKQSYISKIFGMYEVNDDECIIVMQNISFNTAKTSIVYDLKGSDMKRFALYREDKPFTGRDTNFKIDHNGQPLYLKGSFYDSMTSVFQYDSQFLLQQQVIDYSLFLIVDREKNMLKMGIIDFMRPFNLFELFQNIYKRMVSGASPTVVQPKVYNDRFFSAMKRYFLRSEYLI